MSSNYFSAFDVHAVKKAVPSIYLTDNQARSILIAVSDQIATRVKAECEADAHKIITAMVDENGGMIRIPQAALHMSSRGVLSRLEDPKNGDYIFTTGEVKKRDGV